MDAYTSISQLNRDAINDVIDLNKKIEEEKEKENPDAKELEKLYLRQLYRGMEINSGLYGGYRFNRPY